jgi:epoxide hydrolase-like protein
VSTAVETITEIRPFQVEIPEEKIDDLRRRIAATRWPSKELVDDRSQGVQLATLKACGVRKVGSCRVAVFVDESAEPVAPFQVS